MPHGHYYARGPLVILHMFCMTAAAVSGAFLVHVCDDDDAAADVWSPTRFCRAAVA